MKPWSILVALLVTAAARGSSGIDSPFGHVETMPLTLLAPGARPRPFTPIAALSRPLGIAPGPAAFVGDPTILIGRPSDRQKVLRSLHIDPHPTPPAPHAEPAKTSSADAASVN